MINPNNPDMPPNPPPNRTPTAMPTRTLTILHNLSRLSPHLLKAKCIHNQWILARNLNGAIYVSGINEQWRFTTPSQYGAAIFLERLDRFVMREVFEVIQHWAAASNGRAIAGVVAGYSDTWDGEGGGRNTER